MKRYLFLGDSVTDCARKRAKKFQSSDLSLGNGWVCEIKRSFERSSLNGQFYNRGYSGCLTNQLMHQDDWWPSELSESHVELCTIMLGINDVWHPFWKNEKHDIQGALEALSQVLEFAKSRARHVVLMEPLALPIGEVTSLWFPILNELTMGQSVLAQQYDAIWVPLQKDLEKEAGSKMSQFLEDGVHPTKRGHELLAAQWQQAVNRHNLLN